MLLPGKLPGGNPRGPSHILRHLFPLSVDSCKVVPTNPEEKETGMATIGSRAHALMALEIHRDDLDAESRGFRKVGSGAFRTAYLHIVTSVVYKVDGLGRQWTYTNKAEVRNARLLAKMAWKHVYIPMVSLYTFKEAGRGGWSIDGMQHQRHDAHVVAMEYIEGSLGRDCDGYQHPGYDEWVNTVGYGSPRPRLDDMHGSNFIIRHSDKKMVPIDLAS